MKPIWSISTYAPSHRAMTELPKRVQVRTSKYPNDAIEQDHRRLKQRLRTMLGLKRSPTAAVVIGGIELAEKIKKGQFKLGELGGRTATDARNLTSCVGSLSRVTSIETTERTIQALP